MLTQFLDIYCKAIKVLMVVSLAIMVALVFGNVVLRYAFNSGLTLSEELSRWLFVWVTFLGAIVAMKDGTHLGTDSLISRLSLNGKKFCFVIAHLLMIFICWLLLRGAWAQAVINFDTTSAVMEVSMAWFYACGIVLAISGGVILVGQLARLATGQLDERELIGIRESEEEPIDIPSPLK